LHWHDRQWELAIETSCFVLCCANVSPSSTRLRYLHLNL
jgi:hypothetical protein